MERKNVDGDLGYLLVGLESKIRSDEKMDEVFIVTVVDYNDGNTSVWGVFSDLGLAESFVDELHDDKELDVMATVSGHIVTDSHEVE